MPGEGKSKVGFPPYQGPAIERAREIQATKRLSLRDLREKLLSEGYDISTSLLGRHGLAAPLPGIPMPANASKAARASRQAQATPAASSGKATPPRGRGVPANGLPASAQKRPASGKLPSPPPPPGGVDAEGTPLEITRAMLREVTDAIEDSWRRVGVLKTESSGRPRG